ncbi:MAG: MOSC N-terminal beta barrel domain-containing protein [Actinobacteria bacterium]|nr:MOSC N-terminal beta barrel domain-containing protein [Actinomycetota bacterium]
MRADEAVRQNPGPMGVLALLRYPVKAMLGESLDAVEVGPSGLRGDRGWVVVDTGTGQRIANKRGPTDPRLRACRAEFLEVSDERLPLRVTLPDGRAVVGDEIEPALSDLLERPVALEPHRDRGEGRLGATGAHHDLAPLHLITTSTLGRLRRAAPSSEWGVHRFRANLLLDDGEERDGFAEDALVGGTLRAPSGLEIKVEIPTPRCVVPTRAHDGLPADPAILRTIVAEHRIDLGAFGNQGCAGAYATISRSGRLATGDRVEVQAPAMPPARSIRDAVAQLEADLVDTRQ